MVRNEGRTPQQIALARRLRRNQTDAEKALWAVLRSRQISGSKFRRQEAIGPYIVDFVCFEKKLIIEIDGGQHGESVTHCNDETRSGWLRKRGYRVLRFWNNDVQLHREAVAESIRASLWHADTPSLQPSPVQGEGDETMSLEPITSLPEDGKCSDGMEDRSPSPGGRELEGGGS